MIKSIDDLVRSVRSKDVETHIYLRKGCGCLCTGNSLDSNKDEYSESGGGCGCPQESKDALKG